MKHLQPLKKMFGLSLLRGQDKNTYVRALAAALLSKEYVSFKEDSDLANLTIKDIKDIEDNALTPRGARALSVLMHLFIVFKQTS